tara:strand:- start:407 stop:568 length:162 start_codon:yes stop_codon:yes gene_type:complete
MSKKIEIGTQVSYSNDSNYIGVIVSIGSTMFKVRWLESNVEEWMPEYALRVIE